MSHSRGELGTPSLPPHLISTSRSSTDLSHSEQEDDWPPECNIIVDNLSYPAVSLDGCAPLNHEAVPTTPSSSSSSSSIPVLNIEDIEGLSACQKCRHTCITWGRFTGPLLIFSIFCIAFVALGRGYLSQLLNWLENLPLICSFSVFVLLFTIISFPFGFGYIILNMAAGYLYGMLRGQAVVSVSVAIGFTIGFVVCRCCMREWAGQYIASSPALLAMTKVVEGPHGFKVILLTRLTPIPFGLQNALFAITEVGFTKALIGSIVGLFPTQVLNTYMGSTVRNMKEILADRADGYIILTIQIIISIVLSLYLVHKAKQELSKLAKPKDVESGLLEEKR